MKTVDVIVPIYNEEECLPEMFARLAKLRELIKPRKLTVTFVDDGSSDGSAALLADYARANEFCRVIKFARNFGHQGAITAALDIAQADYVAIIDGDLQDPPELIASMVAVLDEGYDVVYGKRRSRLGESWFKLVTARAFYRMMSRILRVPVPNDTGDFRVITQRVAAALRGMPERHRFLRGMVPWLGFKSREFEYDRDRRYAGTTKFSLPKMVRFALDAIFSFSNHPLRLATYLGMLLTGAAMLLAAIVLYLRIFTDFTVPGISAVLFAVLMIGGLQSLILGVSGEYLGRIYEQVKNRPLYVVDCYLNVENTGAKNTSDRD